MPLIDIPIALFQSIILCQCIGSRFEQRRNSRGAAILFVAGNTLYLAVYSLTEQSIPMFLGYTLLWIYGWYESKGDAVASLYWTLVLGAISVTASNVAFSLYICLPHFILEDLADHGMLRLMAELPVNAALVRTCIRIARLPARKLQPNLKVYGTFLLQLFGILLLEEVAESLDLLQYGLKVQYLVINCVLLGLGVLVVVHQSNEEERGDRELFLQARDERERRNREHYEELQRLYEELQQEKHDLKQHIQAVKGLLQREQEETALSYWKNYEQALEESSCCMTGNAAVDSLLRMKKHMMQKQGVELTVEQYPLDILPIPESELCSLFGNLLDNAAEGTLASGTEGEKMVRLRFFRTLEMFTIICTNPCMPGMPAPVPGSGKSTKADRREQHGLGLASIDRIAQKYEGYCSFVPKNGVFTAQVILHMSQNSEADRNKEY